MGVDLCGFKGLGDGSTASRRRRAAPVSVLLRLPPWAARALARPRSMLVMLAAGEPRSANRTLAAASEGFEARRAAARLMVQDAVYYGL